MARPRCDEERELETLENLSAMLCEAEDILNAVDVRIRQVWRRALGDPDLLKVVRPAVEQVGQLDMAVHSCRDLTNGILADKQERRSEDNKGRKR